MSLSTVGQTGLLLAQQNTGEVTVRVLAGLQPLPDVAVQSGDVGRLTNDRGEATLRLLAGLRRIVVSSLGYRPDTLEVLIRSGRDTLLTISLEIQPETIAPIVVSVTRTERRIEEEPERVETLPAEDIDEKAATNPSALTTVLSEMSGLRVQSTAPSLGAASLRIHGLPGRYTLLLADGLPLSAGEAAHFGLAQQTPVDLRQVEVIKGTSSALYGPSAVGGVVNLLSRRPSGRSALLLNQTTRRGTDGVLWASDLVRDAWGATLTAGGHYQKLRDVDGDGWSDIPGEERASARPRFFWSSRGGSTGLVTIGGLWERRRGGTLPGSLAPDGRPFPLELETRRGDGGGHVRLLVGDRSRVDLRAAASQAGQDFRFGDRAERHRRTQLFAEATFGRGGESDNWVAGAALGYDLFRSPDLPQFDFTYTTISGFATGTHRLGPRAAFSGALRLDHHDRYGDVVTGRASGLLRVSESWSVRASGGTGWFAPTPLVEEVSEVGLAPLVIPQPLRLERAVSGSVDVHGELGALELDATAFLATLHHPVQVRATPDPPMGLALLNGSSPTRAWGIDFFCTYRREPLLATATWGYLQATEVDPEEGDRQAVPVNPRNTAALDVAFEEDESGTRLGVELYYTGSQRVEYNPYRTTTPAYTTVELLAGQRIGRVTAFVHVDNLTNIRQTDFDPLLRPAPGPGGRWTTDVWAPLEGRTLNGGIRVHL